MACASDNFDQDATELQWARDVMGVLAENYTESTGDGGFGTSGSGTTILDQSLDWTNTSGEPLRVTPIFQRPRREVRSNAPVQLYLVESHGITTGASPAVPTLANNVIMGGGFETNEGCLWMRSHEDPMTYCPAGQFLIAPGEQVRVRYRVMAQTEGSGFVAGQYIYARWHRIVLIGDVVPVL